MTRLLLILALALPAALAGAQTRVYPEPVGQAETGTGAEAGTPDATQAPPARGDETTAEPAPRPPEPAEPSGRAPRTLYPTPVGQEDATPEGEPPTPAPGTGSRTAEPGSVDPTRSPEAGEDAGAPAPSAAAPDPVVRLTLEAESAVPGQPVRLRLTVLVPTWLPTPPVLPTYDLPNLMVRLPAKSTSPTSQRVEGETWNGITRSYVLIPLIPGQIDLPPQEVTVTYADPETREPLTFRTTTGALTLTGTVPDGAGGLDPFIAARGLTLEQTVEGPGEDLQAGAAVTRRITIEVAGTVPMAVPPLLSPDAPLGLSAYSEDPEVEMTEYRGMIGGTRTEAVTYVAAGGGSFSLPAIELDWFNLESGAVETASAEAVSFEVSGPAAQAAGKPSARDRRIVRLMPILAVVLFSSLLYLRYWPRVRVWRAERRAAWEASEDGAWNALNRAIRARDFSATLPALDLWLARRPEGRGPLPDPLREVLASLGAARYRPGEGGSVAESWTRLERRLEALRGRDRAGIRHRQTSLLAPLNPGHA